MSRTRNLILGGNLHPSEEPFPLPLGDPRTPIPSSPWRGRGPPCAGGVYGGSGVCCLMLSYLTLHTSRSSTIFHNGPVCVRQSKPPPHHQHHRRRRCKKQWFLFGGGGGGGGWVVLKGMGCVGLDGWDGVSVCTCDVCDVCIHILINYFINYLVNSLMWGRVVMVGGDQGHPTTPHHHHTHTHTHNHPPTKTHTHAQHISPTSTPPSTHHPTKHQHRPPSLPSPPPSPPHQP